MTLTEAVFWTKRAGLALIVATLLFIPIRIIIMIIAQGNMAGPGTKLPFASQRYGSLPDLSLQGLSLDESSEPSFFLETPAGEFPDITKVAQVYKLDEKQQSLTALDEAKELARKLKFEAEPSRIPNSNKYQWNDNFGRILTFDVSTQNFNLNTDFQKDVYDLKSPIPDLDTAEERVISFLESLGLYDTSYRDGFVEKRFIKFGPTGEYLISNSQIEADLIRLDFFRSTKLLQYTEEEKALIEAFKEGNRNISEEDLPEEIMAEIRTQEIVKSNVSLLIRGTNFNKIGEIYELNYNFWPINEDETETYYVKYPAEAWDDVKTGKAFLRYLVPKGGEPFAPYTPINVSQFLIYDMSLVYLESTEYQSYLQPVYLIKGEARTLGNTGKPDLDFMFMTPAVKYY